MSQKTIQKVFAWIAKIATLIISAPATWWVADQVFTIESSPGVPSPVEFIVKTSAVVLVEVTFLYFWLFIENKDFREKTPIEVYRVYVLCAWAMYGLLVLIGVLHGERLAAIPLRGSIGLLLFVGTWDTLQHFIRKDEDAVAKGTKPSRRVIKEQNKANEHFALSYIRANVVAYDQELGSLQNLLNAKANDRLQKQLEKQNTGLILPDVTIAKQPVAKSEVVVIKPKQAEKHKQVDPEQIIEGSLVYENGTYQVTYAENKYVMECLVPNCKYKVGYDTEVGAKRSGSAHKKKHRTLPASVPQEEISFSK